MTGERLADATAICLSGACLVHCLGLPLLLAMLPWLVPSSLQNEDFHRVAVCLALPVSVFALRRSLRTAPTIVVLAALGLALLGAGLLVESEPIEVAVSVAGAALLAIAHWWNQQLRRLQTPGRIRT